jgi:hypothetical protein
MKKAAFLASCVFLSAAGACEPDAPIAADDDGGQENGHEMKDSGTMDGSHDAGHVKQADASVEHDAGNKQNDASTDHDSGLKQADSSMPMCTDTPIAQLCIRGTPLQNQQGEELKAGEPVQLQLAPKGCFSSACTVADVHTCQASVQDYTVSVSGEFCIHSQGQCTLPDCSGGGHATCDSGANLQAGQYTAKLGDLSVGFVVPSTLPSGGTCVGDPFQQ